METEREADKLLAAKLFEQLRAGSPDPSGVGVCRPSYSDAETAGLGLIERFADGRVFDLCYDAGANLHLSLCGREPELPAVACGSHMDSVPRGGNYDGAAGIVAGLLALRRLARRAASLRRTVTLLGLRGEESAWFGRCYLGAHALFGGLDVAALALSRRDTPGVTLAAHLRAQGGAPDVVGASRRL